MKIEGILSRALTVLFDDKVSVGVVAVNDSDAIATAAELEALGQVVDKRLKEFSAGRAAGRVALSGLNLPPSDILIGAHRQPLPPAGTVLSISHDDLQALAVAASAQFWWGVGVDIAHADALSDDLIARICRGTDLNNLRAGESVAERAKLVFCLKEALFKAVFPQVSDWMDFSQSELLIDHQRGSFDAKLFTANGAPLDLKGSWFGRFTKCENRWLAVAGLQRR